MCLHSLFQFPSLHLDGQDYQFFSIRGRVQETPLWPQVQFIFSNPPLPRRTFSNKCLEFSLFLKCIYLFIGCSESLLPSGFLQGQQVGTVFVVVCRRLIVGGHGLQAHTPQQPQPAGSAVTTLRLCGVGSVAVRHGLSRTGLVTPQQVDSSQTRGQTCVPCTGRQISYSLHHRGSLDALTSIWLLSPVWNQIQKGGRKRGFPGDSDGKESACNVRDLGSNPGSRRPPEGNGNLLQQSCLENPMDKGVLWATVYEVAKSQTQLSDQARAHTHFHYRGYMFNSWSWN